MVRTRFWLLGVLLGLAACPSPQVLLPPEDAGPRPSLELGSPVVELGTAELRYGERVRRDGFVSLRLNDATEPLVLDATARAPACLGADCLASTTLTLEPGVWQQVPVAIELSAVGRVSRVVSFSSPSRGVAAVSVELIATGTVAPDCLEVDSSHLDFGPLERGCPVKERTLRLTNACAVPRTLHDLVVVPSSAPFAVSQQISLPRRLGPGESWTGLVEFLGGELGAHQADLHLQVDGALGAVVSLGGARTENGPREFSFVAPSPQVDLLVVLDTSPSFASKRAAIERKIVDDVSSPAWYAGPLKVAVVGTSGPSLVWGPALPWHENLEVDFAASVQNALTTLPAGDEVEQCLGAAAQISDSANFWRFGSRRLAVCVTDAPDQTLGPSHAISVLADAGVRYDVVGPPLLPLGPDSECDLEGLDDGIHIAGTGGLGGEVHSICDDWHLPKLPLVPPMPLVYSLPVTPRFPISVFIDGQEVLPADWNWDSARRRLEVRQRPLHMLVVVEAITCAP